MLASLSSLRELLLAGGSPGNSICAIASYRAAMATALPQLVKLDGQTLEAERRHQQGMEPAAAAQKMASLQLQAFQPAPPVLAAFPPGRPHPAAALESYGDHAHQGVPVVLHHVAPGQDAAACIANGLVQRLAQSGALLNLWGNQQQGTDAREGRVADLESRLAVQLDEGIRAPLEPIENGGRADREGPRRKRSIAEKLSNGSAHGSGSQAPEIVPEVDALQV